MFIRKPTTMSASDKLYSLLNWVIPMNVILSMVVRARKEQRNECKHCDGIGYTEHRTYHQYSYDSDSSGFDDDIIEIQRDECSYCICALVEINRIESMLSNNIFRNQKDDNIYLLYQFTYFKYYSLKYTPSVLEFELYIWFMLLNSFDEFIDVISMYVVDGYDLYDIYNCIQNITTNGNYFDSCPTEFKVYVDLTKLFIHVPYLSNPFSKFKKEYKSYCWQSQCWSDLVEFKFYDCLNHQNAIDLVLDNTIPNIDTLRQFCDMMNLDIDIDNMLRIFYIQENGEMEEYYFNRLVSYQQMKDAEIAHTIIATTLYGLFLKKTPLYDLVEGIYSFNKFLNNLFYIRNQYNYFCSEYYVGHSEKLSHDDLYEVYVISKAKGTFGNYPYSYIKEFIAVQNLYDDFTEQYKINGKTYDAYLPPE